jgi:hypothetical protein
MACPRLDLDSNVADTQVNIHCNHNGTSAANSENFIMVRKSPALSISLNYIHTWKMEHKMRALFQHPHDKQQFLTSDNFF